MRYVRSGYKRECDLKWQCPRQLVPYALLKQNCEPRDMCERVEPSVDFSAQTLNEFLSILREHGQLLPDRTFGDNSPKR